MWGKHNFPGSWNDGNTSLDFQLKLLDPARTNQNSKVASDTAFPVTGDLAGRIITPLKDGELDKLPLNLRRGAMRMHSAIISIRQAAEWGMGAVEKVWRILQLRLPFDPLVRQLRLDIIHRLYNLRVRFTGISEIRTVFARDAGSSDSVDE